MDGCTLAQYQAATYTKEKTITYWCLFAQVVLYEQCSSGSTNVAAKFYTGSVHKSGAKERAVSGAPHLPRPRTKESSG